MNKQTYRNFSTVMFVAILVMLAVVAYHIGSIESHLESLEYRHTRLGEWVDWSVRRHPNTNAEKP